MSGPFSKILNAFCLFLQEAGFRSCVYKHVSLPFKTQRGTLWAKGQFMGPTPRSYESHTQNPEVIYDFYVYQDLGIEDVFTIEVRLLARPIAEYDISDGGLTLIHGGLPSMVR